MPELKCMVQTCVHNQNSYCDLDVIRVGGKSATCAGDTCCDSFQEKKSGDKNAYENAYSSVAAGTASPRSEVDCSAAGCRYNSGCRCSAGKISVEGSKACKAGQTECATFTSC